MSAVPLASFDRGSLGDSVARQLRLLDGGTSGARPVDLEARPTSLAHVVHDAVRVAPVLSGSLAGHLRELAATHTCFCCGATMSALDEGSGLRCAACGAETRVILAA
jgi:DNA-directed RNA polymerase subunit RPC12/RpoP